MSKNKELIQTRFKHLKLRVLLGTYKYVHFADSASLWKAFETIKSTGKSDPLFLFHAGDDKSLVVPEEAPVSGIQEQAGWKAIRVIGDMPFGTVHGLLATISDCLKTNNIGVCVISTYLTDFFLVLEKDFEKAIHALKEEGWEFVQ